MVGRASRYERFGTMRKVISGWRSNGPSMAIQAIQAIYNSSICRMNLFQLTGFPFSTAVRPLHQTSLNLVVNQRPPPGRYKRKQVHAIEVVDFLSRALKNPGWRGRGLEFDFFESRDEVRG